MSKKHNISYKQALVYLSFIPFYFIPWISFFFLGEVFQINQDWVHSITFYLLFFNIIASLWFFFVGWGIAIWEVSQAISKKSKRREHLINLLAIGLGYLVFFLAFANGFLITA